MSIDVEALKCLHCLNVYMGKIAWFWAEYDDFKWIEHTSNVLIFNEIIDIELNHEHNSINISHLTTTNKTIQWQYYIICDVNQSSDFHFRSTVFIFFSDWNISLSLSLAFYLCQISTLHLFQSNLNCLNCSILLSSLKSICIFNIILYYKNNNKKIE